MMDKMVAVQVTSVSYVGQTGQTATILSFLVFWPNSALMCVVNVDLLFAYSDLCFTYSRNFVLNCEQGKNKIFDLYIQKIVEFRIIQTTF